MRIPIAKLVEVLNQINFLHIVANRKDPHHDEERDSPETHSDDPLHTTSDGVNDLPPGTSRPPPRK